MLTEKRQEEILRLLDSKGSVTVQELTELLHTSESTIRRDLNILDRKKLLVKVFGGAVLAEQTLNVREDKVSIRSERNLNEKTLIGRHAASLIEPEDFVFLDAGTTTGCMIPFLTEPTASYITNAVSHALKLAEKGFHVTLIGGEVKSSTEAIVGNEAYANLQKYYFTKCFLGANGVSHFSGFTTPDVSEAMIKECAIKHSRTSYILCDHTKFHQIAPVNFACFDSAVIITDKIPSKEYSNTSNIKVAE